MFVDEESAKAVADNGNGPEDANYKAKTTGNRISSSVESGRAANVLPQRDASC